MEPNYNTDLKSNKNVLATDETGAGKFFIITAYIYFVHFFF